MEEKLSINNNKKKERFLTFICFWSGWSIAEQQGPDLHPENSEKYSITKFFWFQIQLFRFDSFFFGSSGSVPPSFVLAGKKFFFCSVDLAISLWKESLDVRGHR